MSNLARNIDATPQGESLFISDTPIDYSVPYKPRIKGASRHFGFFPFFAKKPWPVVQEYIKHFTFPGDLVCDPFAGSGVTPVEALVLGRRTIASDINPVARFITRMTAIAPVDLKALREAYEYVRSIAQEPVEALNSMTDMEVQSLLQNLDYPRVQIPKSVRRAGADTIDQLHTPRQLAGLTILRDAINQFPEELLRNLLKVALGSTVRYTNKTYSLPLAGEGKKRRAIYRGNANFLRRFSFSLASEKLFYEHLVWPTFERTFQNVLEAKEETNHLIGERYNTSNFRLYDVPALRIHEVAGEETIDYCFTDPPYSNDIHFVDLSVLWAAWLGLEIPDEVRRNELLIGGSEGKSRQQFEQEFAASMESIARCLKQDRWLTLVYKHRDLSLWQTIVAACEQSGLQYINAVWQDLKIASTKQIESPNINPSGDMYLNFRKMTRQKFESTYPKAVVLDIPTRPRYVEKEIERLIVSYLGADIRLIVSGVIQQILDSRAFKDYRENPDNLNQDIQAVLKPPRFEVWQPNGDTRFWVLGNEVSLDSSLPAIDRARYYVFSYLRSKGEITEGEVNRYLLTRFSEMPDHEIGKIDIPSLLRQVGKEISHRRWQFDAAKVTKYKQLRLLFQHSKADEIRERIEDRESGQPMPLSPNFEGITLLLDRLREVNTLNNNFEAQANELLGFLKVILSRFVDYFEDEIEKVLAIGEWAQFGIDLRNLVFEDVMLQIVLRLDDRPFALYREIAEKVFGNLNDDQILIQFQLLTLNEWEQTKELAQLSKREETLGISLLDRI